MPTADPVLLMTNTLGVGGAERYVVTVANWMAARGLRVDVVADEGPLGHDLDPQVRLHTLAIKDVRWRLPLVALQVRRLLRDRRPAAIVANTVATAWVARAAQGRRRIPTVAVAHGWPAERYRAVGRLIGVADTVVAVSPEVRERLVAAGLAPHRCEVVFNGIDCTPFGPTAEPHRSAAREEMGAGPDDLVVLNVGRTMPQKAHQHVITVANLLRTSHPRLRFAVVGGGELDGELRARAARVGLADRVRFLGERGDVARLLGAADIFFSCSDWEGMPLSTIEGMASGLPAVATRTEGSTHLLDESCGLLVPVGDTGAMARALARLADDDALRASLGAAAAARARERFSQDRMVGALADILARHCGG